MKISKSFIGSTWIASVFLAYVVCLPAVGFGQNSGKVDPKPKRARLPKPSDFPQGIFFKNAFQESLVGTRPARLGKRPTSNAGSSTAEAVANNEPKGLKWSELVSARTLEDEVKSLQMSVQKSVTTPGRFSGGGYREVRRQFTELATLFAVIHKYDGTVRWQKQAAHARDAFGRAAANAKVASAQVFNQAKQRKFDLEELVRGGSIPTTKPASPENDWSTICDRGPLMQRFTGSYDEGLMIWTSSETEFQKNLANIQKEAELLKLFSEILKQDGMEDAGDEDYERYCDELSSAATAVLRSVSDKDAKAARQATSMVGKSCTRCHEDYRG